MKNFKPIILQGSQPKQGESQESFTTEAQSFGQPDGQIASNSSHLFSKGGEG